MARRRRERMSEGKKNIIAGLIEEYDIKTTEDIQEALKELLGVPSQQKWTQKSLCPPSKNGHRKA